MGETTQQHTEPYISVVGASPVKRKRQRLWKLCLSVAIIVALGIGTYVFTSHKETATESTVQKKTTQTKQQVELGKLSKLAWEGKVQEAIAGYNELLAQAKTNDAKRTILMAKATTYMNSGDYDEALAVARAANSISSDDDTLSAIADIYAARGDTVQAAAYYQKALDYARVHARSTAYYTAQLKELGQ